MLEIHLNTQVTMPTVQLWLLHAHIPLFSSFLSQFSTWNKNMWSTLLVQWCSEQKKHFLFFMANGKMCQFLLVHTTVLVWDAYFYGRPPFQWFIMILHHEYLFILSYIIVSQILLGSAIMLFIVFMSIQREICFI